MAGDPSRFRHGEALLREIARLSLFLTEFLVAQIIIHERTVNLERWWILIRRCGSHKIIWEELNLLVTEIIYWKSYNTFLNEFISGQKKKKGE